jgi:hypothetical protein
VSTALVPPVTEIIKVNYFFFFATRSHGTKNVELLENGFRGIQYLIRSTAEPGIPGRTTMPKNTLDTKNGVVLFFLFFFALVLICLAIVGYYCFFCLLLRQHCLRFFY